MIRLKNLHKTLQRQKILRGIDLTIQDGEKLAVIGRSGGGKSVLLRHILGLMKPDAGEVWYNDVDLTRLDEERLTPLRREMGMAFQNGALFDSMSVSENVSFSLTEQERNLGAAEVSERVAEALAMVGLEGQERKMPSDLSGGMRKRVAFARAAIRKPKLMLYDEPTTGLDPIMSDSINKLILRLARENQTIVVVTHDMVSAYEIADKIALLHEGKIYCQMTPKEIQASTDPIIHKFVCGISEESERAALSSQ